MIKKEFNEVLKQSLFFILVIVLVPFINIIESIFSKSEASYIDIFFPVFQAGLLFFSLFMGISLFSFERRGSGMEYLLSLPFSRLKLLSYKILPRITVVILFYLLFIFLYNTIGINKSFITYTSFFYLYFIIFIVALYFSTAHDNFVISTVSALFAFTFYLGIIYLLYKIAIVLRGGKASLVKFEEFFMLGQGHSEPKLIFFTLICLLIPLIISFVVAFKKFDTRPARNFNKRYFKVFVPLFILCLGLSFIFAYNGLDTGYRHYYLTQSHKLFEYDGYLTRIYDKNGVNKIKDFPYLSWYSTIEDNNFIYDSYYYSDGYDIIRLNLKNNKIETLYKEKNTKTLGHWLFKYKGTLAFFEIDKKTKNNYLVLLNLNSKRIKRLKIPDPLNLGSRIFGTDEIEGKRFWLICPNWGKKYLILQLWEDGKYQKLGESLRHPQYINGMLIYNNERAMVFEKFSEKGPELIKEIPEGKDFTSSMWIRTNLNNIHIKEIYGYITKRKNRSRYRKMHKLDLNNFQITEIEKSESYIRYFFPDNFYTFELGHDKDNNHWVKKIYRLKDGKKIFLKEFKDIDPRIGTNLSSAGIVCKQKGKMKVYVFPDLRELHFKKLN